MRFDFPALLLLLIPALGAIIFGMRRLRLGPTHLRFPALDTVKKARPSSFGSWVNLPRWLQAMALILAIIALARPQVEEPSELTGEGLDFVIALDMSGSMNAVDMPAREIILKQAIGREPPNRFEAASEVIKRFIRSRDQDRFGLVIFANKAFVKFPLTMDQEATLKIIDDLVLDDMTRTPDGYCTNACTITGESTAIGDALARAYKRLEDSETTSRNIILITDGDNNSGTADPEEVAKYIGQQTPDRPVKVYSFLVGGGDDTFLPAYDQRTGRQLRNARGLRVYEKAEQDFPVNPELLRRVAEVTGGEAFEVATEKEFQRAFDNLVKTRFESPSIRNYREVFMWPLGLAIFLLLTGEVLAMTIWRRWP
ncbi:MAG: VWA domain-containing protein [Myxococcota bacterium]|nr:VWA domain-containing protein [Oligoflexales bacterium]HOE82715.1 VWA domain-containing protein [Myxococcota bacterium]HON24709.1 VWA domain-containing protein [Myxococcota bacterium]HOS62176.1 VWA domain-containing protein [Myxococcota bacterium]HPC91875.1 VWA domain-containing protein [Myxococcota bacterium]